jgi:hypothetical protein
MLGYCQIGFFLPRLAPNEDKSNNKLCGKKFCTTPNGPNEKTPPAPHGRRSQFIYDRQKGN